MGLCFVASSRGQCLQRIRTTLVMAMEEGMFLSWVNGPNSGCQGNGDVPSYSFMVRKELGMEIPEWHWSRQ